MDIFRRIPRYSAGASFLLQGFFLCSVLPPIGEHKDYAHEVQNESNRAMDSFFPNFNVVLCPF